MDALVAYPWPGNIRELDNIIARAVLMEQSRTLQQVDLPSVARQHRSAWQQLPAGGEDMPMKEACRIALEALEREYLKRLLTRTRGNISRAAQQAGINRRTLYNKLDAYRIRRRDFIPSE
jgi:two-component system response regulator AtoC